MRKIESIHFVGIKGAGMTPLAVMAKEAGIRVTGSDVGDVFITDEILKKNEIRIFKGFDPAHVGSVDLIVATGAHGGLENIEVKEAKRKGIKVITQGEAVGLFMKGEIFRRDFTGISICGTNGKTTTSSMVATILKNANLDPSYLIGTSFVESLGFAGRLGKGKYFIAEADEYATDPVFDKTAKFLWQSPKILVVTNIDFDHPDIYPSIKEIKEAFKKFILKLPKNGLLVACGDDSNVQEILDLSFRARSTLQPSRGISLITYGMSPRNDYVISDIKTENAKTQFRVTSRSSKHDILRVSSVLQNESRSSRLCSNNKNFVRRFDYLFKLNIFGEQNVFNATAAIIVGRYLGLSIDQLKEGISIYKGSKRRSEFIGKLSTGALVFDDYAHNPTKIVATLKAFRSAYPKKKIVCIFQPHTYSRTKYLFEQFSRSFTNADVVIISDIYASLRERKDSSVSSKRLADAIKHSFCSITSKESMSLHRHLRGGPEVVFLPRLQDVVEYLNYKQYGEDTVIITMGAGDVYKIGQKLQLC